MVYVEKIYEGTVTTRLMLYTLQVAIDIIEFNLFLDDFKGTTYLYDMEEDKMIQVEMDGINPIISYILDLFDMKGKANKFLLEYNKGEC